MARIEQKTEAFGDAAVRVTWSAMKAGDTAEEAFWSRHADRSVQITGNFGGARVEVHGSNDGENFVALTDVRGNVLSFLSPAIEQIEDCSFALRPVVVGGDGSTNINVILFARKG